MLAQLILRDSSQSSMLRSLFFLREIVHSMINKIFILTILSCLLLGMTTQSGCRHLRPQPMPDQIIPDFAPVQNPLTVPMLPRALVMDEISDELDNYFRIKREERVRLADGILTEGWIETHPEIGGTAIEPWKRNSTPGFELAHATFQTVRRFAKVRIIPTENAYFVDLKVYKEQEDLPVPQESSLSGRAAARHDNTLDIDEIPEEFQQVERGWIPMGRDISLESAILQNIQTRLQTVAAAK